MAIELITSSQTLIPADFRRSRPICSGDANADAAYGLRGIHAEINHAYAYLVGYLSGNRAREASTPDNPLASSTNNPGVTDLFPGDLPFAYGENVSAILFLADLENGVVQINNTGNPFSTQASASIVSRTTTKLTCTRAAGGAAGVGYCRIQGGSNGGPIMKLWAWSLYEVALVATDIDE